MAEPGKHGDPSCAKLGCYGNCKSELWNIRLEVFADPHVWGMVGGAVELLQVKGSQSYLLGILFPSPTDNKSKSHMSQASSLKNTSLYSDILSSCLQTRKL